MSVREVFAFPEIVNDYAARCTAGLVVALAVITIAVPAPVQTWLAGALVVGFALRVAGGPRYSPFGRLSVHVLAPRVSAEPKMVAGAPKRFAQSIGLVMSGVAFGLFLAGQATPGRGAGGAARRRSPRPSRRPRPPPDRTTTREWPLRPMPPTAPRRRRP